MLSIILFTPALKLLSNWLMFKPVWPNHIRFTESGFKAHCGVYTAAP